MKEKKDKVSPMDIIHHAVLSPTSGMKPQKFPWKNVKASTLYKFASHHSRLFETIQSDSPNPFFDMARKYKYEVQKDYTAPSDELCTHFFKEKQKEYDVEIQEMIFALRDRFIAISTFEGRTPTETDYENVSNELKEELKKFFHQLDTGILFTQGADDTASCGKILIFMETKWEDERDEMETVCLMSGIQWLLRKAHATNTEDEESQEIIPTPTDNYKSALFSLLKMCQISNAKTQVHINDKTWGKYRILATILFILRDTHMCVFKNETEFAGMVNEYLNSNAETIRKSVNKVLNIELKEFPLPLKDLNEDSIKASQQRHLRDLYKRNWDGMYEYISDLIKNNDQLRALRLQEKQ